MSRMYFHAKDEDVEVAGPDRHWLARVSEDIGETQLGLSQFSNKDHWILPLLDCHGEERHIRSTLRHGDRKITVGDREFEPWTLNLNAAMRLGSRSIKLAVRIHAQCEIHLWVEDKNRGWLAGLIEDALKINVCRPNMGWDNVISLMRKDNVGPVFMSFSVTESFPDGVLPYDHENDEPVGGWDEAVEHMREKERALELKPDNFDDYYFRDGADFNTVHELVKGTKPGHLDG